MMKYLFIVSVAFTCVSAQFFSDCGSKLATLNKLKVEGCQDDADECVLKRNTNVTFNIDFTPNQDLGKVNTIVHGIVMDVPVPFALPQPNACKDAGLTCPIKASTECHYSTMLPILKAYPKIKVGVKWELQNEKKEDIICVLINAKLH